MDRTEIFALAAEKLRAEFQELRSISHNALKGHEAEDIVRRFLRDHIPRRFDVGSGFLLDPVGEVSRQTDVVVYDAFNCPVYRASPDAAIFPSNNVAAVVEVKSRLTKTELADAARKTAAIKGLRKAEHKDGSSSSQTYCAVFAFAADAKLTTLLQNYQDTIYEHGLGRHIDQICILDKGILTLAVKPPGEAGWAPVVMGGFGGPDAEGTHVAASAGSFGTHSLDAFFRLFLMALIMFRGVVDHPGFAWSTLTVHEDRQLLSYLTSLTGETDPIKRQQKLRDYAEEVQDIVKDQQRWDDWKGP